MSKDIQSEKTRHNAADHSIEIIDHITLTSTVVDHIT